MAWLKFLVFVFLVLLVLAVETMSGAFAQDSSSSGGYFRGRPTPSDQPWMGRSQFQPQSYGGRQNRYQGVIEAKRQRGIQQTYATANAALAQADQALAAGNRQGAWTILNSVRNSLEGLVQSDSRNPLWGIGLAEMYACDSYPRPDRAQMYLDMAISAYNSGGGAQFGPRIARAKSLVAFGRNVHKNATHFSPYDANATSSRGIDSSGWTDGRRQAADRAWQAGDREAASRISGGYGSQSDSMKYGH